MNVKRPVILIWMPCSNKTYCGTKPGCCLVVVRETECYEGVCGEDRLSVPVHKKCRVDLVPQSAGEVKEVCRKFEVYRLLLAARHEKIKKLKLKLQLLAKDSEKVARIQT